ncbi:MAG: aminotransferase class I/II-fold pyridoxal phosphate-dependent enzyme, partial [Muribaculaceae bacterium]|nr:aminotransferase class I/II-fold pyridoxal phosphate-dependent enzyme [Muribaculaceae bacterium]
MKACAAQIEALKAARNFRTIPADSTADRLVDLSGNDYLGIAADQSLKAEFLNSFAGAEDFPALSASASRLLAADQSEFCKLEQLLADIYRRPVLLFNSGYHANSGSIAALAKGRTLIVADKLVHASIIDGMMLSKADFERFRHNDVAHLRRILAKRAKDYERVLIVCESVYSMDGDFAPLEEIAASKTDNSLLYVDEAHAFGVCGPDGFGLAAGMAGVDVLIGTLGKAAGSVGAFAALSSNVLRDYLVNT